MGKCGFPVLYIYREPQNRISQPAAFIPKSSNCTLPDEKFSNNGQSADPMAYRRGQSPEPHMKGCLVMPKFTYDTDKSPEEVFGVPLGSYVARFLGDEEVPPFDGPSKFKQAGPP